MPDAIEMRKAVPADAHWVALPVADLMDPTAALEIPFVKLAFDAKSMYITQTMNKQAYYVTSSAWVSPTGDTHPVQHSHEEEAPEIAQQVYGTEFDRSSYSGYLFLISRSWMRVSYAMVSFAFLTAATRQWLRQYIEQNRMPRNEHIEVERWVINSQTYSVDSYRTLYDGPAADAWDTLSAVAALAPSTDGLTAVADWEDYLQRLEFDVPTFFQYARPGQIWSYTRRGQGGRLGQTVRRFVHLGRVDDARGYVSGAFGYSWDDVVNAEAGYQGEALPVADAWSDIHYIASYKPYAGLDFGTAASITAAADDRGAA
jgi:hypothetical protein